MSNQGERNIVELHSDARTALLECAEREYEVWSDVYETADRKAQATMTIASALLAAALAFVAKVDAGSAVGFRLALTLITFFLAVSIFFALWAMRVRPTATPPSTEWSQDEYKDVLSAKTASDFDRARVLADEKLLKEWIEANQSVCEVGNEKADWVSRAQKALFAAAAVTFILVLFLIWNPLSLPLRNEPPNTTDLAKQLAAQLGSQASQASTPAAPTPSSAAPEQNKQTASSPMAVEGKKK